MPDYQPEDREPFSENGKPRIGVYVCHCGGNISDVVNVEKVAEAIGKLPDVVISRHNTFMCSDPGQNLIAEDIRNENLNRVVVAACSPSLHELTFRQTLARSGLNSYLYEHCNIREQVSWVTKSDPEGSTDKAIRLVAAAVAKARYLRPLEPIRVDAKDRVVVIGGGVQFQDDVGLKVDLEVRYTRWLQKTFDAGPVQSNLNQGEFLLGLTF